MEMLFSIFFCITFLSPELSIAVDTLFPNQTLRDNGEVLVSAAQTFALGFFSPWNSNNRYIGIWFNSVPDQTVVWVANRDFPVTDSSGILTINATGNVHIHMNGSSIPIWSSNSSSVSNNSILQLLDTGNLVVKDAADSGSNFFWQSFDHPCDTLLQGMKLGMNLRTNQSWFLSSWRSVQDPSTGDYTHRLQATEFPQLVLRRGSSAIYRSGPWNGVQSGRFRAREHIFRRIYVSNSTFVYFAFATNDSLSRFVLNPSGFLQQLSWNGRRGEWIDLFRLPRDECDNYEKCGPNGICNADNDIYCRCLSGFIPKIQQDWDTLDWSGGCTRRIELDCNQTEGFRRISGVKLPDNSHYFRRGTSVTQTECEVACSRNCSCMAYAQIGNECFMWFGSLLDIREFSDGGLDLHIKLAASELEAETGVRNNTVVIVIVSVAASVLLLVLISCCYAWKRGHKKRQGHDPTQEYESSAEEDLDLPLFDMETIKTAVNNFAEANKIGEGGFGHVYKGVLPTTGQEIAVKRLSKDSRQGLQELKNEVIMIAKLQHRNLVRLLGCCLHNEEKMLIYEYMPNRSLDFYIFNQTSTETALEWKKRFDIIVGIARGLLYLHRDSRLRIIHRDLKTSNILLDKDMNPKISDFGLARIFGSDQTEANTTRVVGTYGYMSPEYALDGLFSVKSDVFSFGVLVLEIISGKSNRRFVHSNHDKNLLGHAWNLWNEDNALELVDSLMNKSVTASEAMKCIQVGLLCVQEHPNDRPTMSSVLSMLESDLPPLPRPKQPGFYIGRFPTEVISSSPHNTENEITITMLQGR